MTRNYYGALAFRLYKDGAMFAHVEGRLESLPEILAALTGRPVEYDEAVMFLRKRNSELSTGQKTQKMIS